MTEQQEQDRQMRYENRLRLWRRKVYAFEFNRQVYKTHKLANWQTQAQDGRKQCEKMVVKFAVLTKQDPLALISTQEMYIQAQAELEQFRADEDIQIQEADVIKRNPDLFKDEGAFAKSELLRLGYLITAWENEVARLEALLGVEAEPSDISENGRELSPVDN